MADTTTDVQAIAFPTISFQAPAASTAAPRRSVVVATLEEVEFLLDWAECRGFRERELVVRGPCEFVVRWQE